MLCRVCSLSFFFSFPLAQGWKVTHVHQEGKTIHLELSFFRYFKLRCLSPNFSLQNLSPGADP